MPNYRRAYAPGGTFFFTVVTYNRKPIFSDEESREILGEVVRECRRDWAFEMNAIVVLPDHIHAIWTMPRNDSNYSARWSRIKKEFTKRWIDTGAVNLTVSPSQQRERRRGVWQRRFWEHTILDSDDFDARFNYIHYNPVKHGLVRCPHDWAASSFHRWVEKDVYPKHWGCSCTNPFTMDFGEIEGACGEPI